MSKLIILGVDPASIRNLGIAILSADTETRTMSVLLNTTVILPDFATDDERLHYIYCKMDEIIIQNNPSVMSIELSQGFGKSFVRKNLQECVGVIKLCCFNNKVKVIEKAPTHIKLIVSGSGKSKKPEMKRWIKKITGIEAKKTEHEADAAASVITYLVDENIIDRIHEPVVKSKKKKTEQSPESPVHSKNDWF